MDRHACACAPHLPIERVLVTDNILVLTVVSLLTVTNTIAITHKK